MKKRISVLILAALFAGSCRGTLPLPPDAEPPARNAGEKALREGDLDAALDWLEKETEKHPQDATLWQILGEAQLQLAEQKISTGGSNLFIASTLADAEASFGKAESLNGNEMRTAVLQTRLRTLQGQIEEAYRWAETAQSRLPAGASAQTRYELGRAVAEASFQKYVAMRRENASAEELAFPFSRTIQALLTCEKIRPQEAWSYEKQADLFQWEEAKLGVLQTLERGLNASPAQASLHGKLQNYLVQQNDAAALRPIYEKLLQAHPQEPVAIWYDGLARILDADAGRRSRQLAAAGAGYENAKISFARSAQMRPEFQESVDHYLAIADFSRGWCLYEERKIEDASSLWLSALRRRPQMKDALDGLGRSVKQGLGLAGAAFVKAKEFEKGRQLHKTLVEIDPQDADWMNNYAFLCREAGTAVEAAGKKESAAALFEESYAAYEKAVALSPQDVRLVNDCALILLYHLDRDLDRAEAMFRQAADLGEKALAQAGLDPSREEELRSATGDAFQNLGVLFAEKKRDGFGARPFFLKSVELGPMERPQVQWYLNRLATWEARMREWMLLWAPAIVPLLGSASTAGQEGEKTASANSSTVSSEIADKIKKAAELLDGGAINDALDLLDEVEKASPDLPDTNFLYGKAFVTKAESLIAQGIGSNQISFSYLDAVRFLERAVEQNPSHGQAWLLLGKAQFGSSETEKAAHAAEQATKFLPKDPESFQLRGEIAFARYQEAKSNDDAEGMKNSSQTALDCFQRATKLSDRFAPAWEKLGDLYAWLGKDAEAKEAYIMAMGIAPKEATGSRLLQRAGAAEWTTVFEKALAESKKLRPEGHKTNAMLFWYLGYAHHSGKRAEKAHEAFTRATKLDPELLSAYYYLGRIEYFDRKEYLKSAEAFGVYAAKNPDALTALVKAADQAGDNLSSIVEFLVGEAYNKGKVATARELARIVAFLDPEKARNWNNYAFFCRETRKYEDSYAAYSNAVEKDPENPQLLNDCALILQYHLHRDLDLAREMYEKAVVNAKAILEGKMKSSASQDEVRTALRDASSNLAKLKLRPQGEESE